MLLLCCFPAGIGALGIFMLLMFSMTLTAGGMYGVYQFIVIKRMQADMRNILEEYVPLNSAPTSSAATHNSVLDKFTAAITPRASGGIGVGNSSPRLFDGASRLSTSSASNDSSNTPLV